MILSLDAIIANVRHADAAGEDFVHFRFVEQLRMPRLKYTDANARVLYERARS